MLLLKDRRCARRAARNRNRAKLHARLFLWRLWDQAGGCFIPKDAFERVSRKFKAEQGFELLKFKREIFERHRIALKPQARCPAGTVGWR